jgi:hypothetical protein
MHIFEFWSDDVCLSHYIFRTNITGNWKDDAPVAFNSTPSWVNVLKVLPSEAGVVVAYRWLLMIQRMIGLLHQFRH